MMHRPARDAIGHRLIVLPRRTRRGYLARLAWSVRINPAAG